jgi:hypothetical protein
MTTTNAPTPQALAAAITPETVAALMQQLMQLQQTQNDMAAKLAAAETARQAAEQKATQAIATALAPEEWLEGIAHPLFPGLTCSINAKHPESFEPGPTPGTRGTIKPYCEFRTAQDVWYLRGPAGMMKDGKPVHVGKSKTPVTFSPEIVLIPANTRCQWSAPTVCKPFGGLTVASLGASSSAVPAGLTYEQTRYAALLAMLANMPDDVNRLYFLEDEQVSRTEWMAEASEQGRHFFKALDRTKVARR